MNITIKQLKDMIHEAIEEVKNEKSSLNEAIEVHSFRPRPIEGGPSCMKCDDTGKKFCPCNGRSRGCSMCENTGEVSCDHS